MVSLFDPLSVVMVQTLKKSWIPVLHSFNQIIARSLSGMRIKNAGESFDHILHLPVLIDVVNWYYHVAALCRWCPYIYVVRPHCEPWRAYLSFARTHFFSSYRRWTIRLLTVFHVDKWYSSRRGAVNSLKYCCLTTENDCAWLTIQLMSKRSACFWSHGVK